MRARGPVEIDDRRGWAGWVARGQAVTAPLARVGPWVGVNTAHPAREPHPAYDHTTRTTRPRLDPAQ
jgi:hypothetical protein